MMLMFLALALSVCAKRPNILVIVADDFGYADMAITRTIHISFSSKTCITSNNCLIEFLCQMVKCRLALSR